MNGQSTTTDGGRSVREGGPDDPESPGAVPPGEFPVDPDDPSEGSDDDSSDADEAALRTLAGLPVGRLRSLAAEYGTPLCVRDLRRLRENYDDLAAGVPDACVRVPAGSLGICDVPTLSTLRRAGAGVVCGSPEEVRTAMDAGVAPARLHYDLSSPSAAELDWLVDHCRGDPGTTVCVRDAGAVARLLRRGFGGRIAVRVDVAAGPDRARDDAVAPDVLADVLAGIRGSARLVGVTLATGSARSGDGDPVGIETAVASVLDDVLALADDRLEFVGVDPRGGSPSGGPDSTPVDVRDALSAVDAPLLVRPGEELLAGARIRLTDDGWRGSGRPDDDRSLVRVGRVEDGPVDRTVLVDEDGDVVEPTDCAGSFRR